ncbi:MAG: helix-turn-helix domain-containing protein [Candidatus Doudnabacteria bacterium]|nr:helix-turn-helix domain-containing protein [Candidatus Doudnabacteria bacterium]
MNFSKKEADVYLGLLELGKATVSVIARKAGLNRTTGYHILDSLAAKGLVSVSGSEPLQEFVAESPEKITVLLQKKFDEYQNYLIKAKATVPQLKSFHNIKNRPHVKFYEGKQGLIDVYEDTLTSHEPLRAFANFDDMHKALPDYFPSYYLRRAKKGLTIRGVVPITSEALEREKHNQKEAREMVFVPHDKYYFTPEIDMYDNKLMIASWKEKLGIIIESAEISDAMKKIFELAWIGAKTLEKNK